MKEEKERKGKKERKGGRWIGLGLVGDFGFRFGFGDLGLEVRDGFRVLEGFRV